MSTIGNALITMMKMIAILSDNTENAYEMLVRVVMMCLPNEDLNDEGDAD